MLLFNAEHGYVEGLIRGLRVGLLNSQNYANLTQCETLGPHPPRAAARQPKHPSFSNPCSRGPKAPTLRNRIRQLSRQRP